jgi:hypothetical protein
VSFSWLFHALPAIAVSTRKRLVWPMAYPSIWGSRELKRSTLRFGGYKVRLVLNLPAVDIKHDQHFFGRSAMTKVRRFFRSAVPEADAALENGSFSITTSVLYHEHQGDRQVVLCRWKAGESISAALDTADAALKDVRRSVKNDQASAAGAAPEPAPRRPGSGQQ